MAKPEPNTAENPIRHKLSFNIGEAVVATGLGQTYIRRLVKEKKIRSVRVGRRILLPRAAIEAWLTSESA